MMLSFSGAVRALVIINEFGEIGLDHLLLVESAEGVTVELNNECLCCTIRHTLVHTLRDARWRFVRGGHRWFDRVVMETTGIVTTVDLVNAEQTLDHYPEAVKQVALADTLLFTKSDLAPDILSILMSSRTGSIQTPSSRLCSSNFGAIACASSTCSRDVLG